MNPKKLITYGITDGLARAGRFVADRPDTILDFADVTLTAAQILALNATPVQLVAAPGANKFLEFAKAILYLKYNSAAYAGIAAGEDLAIKYENAAGLQLGSAETTNFL